MANQITQKQMFTALIDLVKENPQFEVKVNGLVATADDTVQFLNSRIEALEKKASKSNDKVSAEQAEVDGKVLSVVKKERHKVGEIVKEVNAEYGVDYSSSRVTASLRRLVEKGAVLNEMEKKNSYYFLAD